MCLPERTWLLIILLLVLPDLLHSQDKQPRVSNVHFYFNPSDNELVIVYDLINTSPLERYEIELLFVDGKNQKIRPLSVFGDLGPDVQGGENKRVIWNIFDDVEHLSESARPLIRIVSAKKGPVDPTLALIMDQMQQGGKGSSQFEMKREGVLIGGLACGVGALACVFKANEYLKEKNLAENLEDYKRAGENADKFYTISYVLGGVSAVSIGYSVYQYILRGKEKKETSFSLVPGLNNEFILSIKAEF
ncbi:MAG: hypothetical protein KFF49_11000 [Bacteroidales bacterium]|nr:hypothetical protein [Bacteroidales bacterium]